MVEEWEGDVVEEVVVGEDIGGGGGGERWCRRR